MYKCRDCKEYFEEPRVYHEKHEFWGAFCYEDFTECPYCGSSDFDDAYLVEKEEEEEQEEDVENSPVKNSEISK